MTIRTIGRPDAFCIHCKREVVADADLACPHCGLPVDERSLARVPSPEPMIVESVTRPSAPEETRDRRKAESGPVSLPAIKESAAWDRATDALIAALEAEERTALAEYERAKERVREFRRGAAAMRQLRGLVTVEQPTPALPAPKRLSAPQVAAGEKRWSRQHDACVNCGTTARKHAVKGRCTACHSYWLSHDDERPRELWAPEEGAPT